MFYDLARGYVQKGHQVRVIARNVGEEYLGHKVIEGLDVYYCPWKSMFGHPLPKKEDMVEHIKWCDVVHTSIFTTAGPVSRLARKYKKPSMLTIYEVRGNKWFWVEGFVKAIAFWLVEQYSSRQKFDMYHTISDASKEDYIKFCGPRDVRRVYLAAEDMDMSIADTSNIDLHDYFEIDHNKKVFLFYGRPGQTKGIYVYEDAIRQLRDREIDLSGVKFCFLLGAEPVELRNRFIDVIHKYHLEEVIVVKDSLPRNDLCKCILQADYVVVPSITEGFGLSALEACQMGKKLVYSDGGSLPEVVYGNCIGFENRNVNDLTNKLKSIVEEHVNAFKKIPTKTFSYEAMVQGVLDLYEELLKR